MKYYLHYVEGCTPKLKKFASKKSLNKFLEKFAGLEEYGDDWAEFYFKTDELIHLTVDGQVTKNSPYENK